MHRCTAIHQDNRALAHHLRLVRSVRIGARHPQQHQRKFARTTQRRRCCIHQRGDVMLCHAGRDFAMNLAQGSQRDVIGALHQGQFGGRFDLAAGVHQRFACYDRAARLAQRIDDKKPHRAIDRDRQSDLAIGQHPGDAPHRAFIFVPWAQFGGNPQRFSHARRFECGGHNHRIGIGANHRCGHALGQIPFDPGEISQRRSGLDHQRADPGNTHQPLHFGNPRRIFGRRNRADHWPLCRARQWPRQSCRAQRRAAAQKLPLCNHAMPPVRTPPCPPPSFRSSPAMYTNADRGARERKPG